MPTFRKKPVVIEAVRCSDMLDLRGVAAADAFNAMPEWFRVAFLAKTVTIDLTDYGDVMLVSTLEGTMTASNEDWLIRGVKGEIYPCKSEIFEATYDPVERVEDPFKKLDAMGLDSARVANGVEMAVLRAKIGDVLHPHAFVRGAPDGLRGPPDETCAVCATDPRNLVHDVERNS